MNDFKPKVFGADGITVCMNGDTTVLWVGTTEVGFIKQMNLNVSGLTQKLEIIFATSQDVEISRKIEESVRVVQSIPWIRVLRD